MHVGVLRASSNAFAVVEYQRWHHDFGRSSRRVGGRIWHQGTAANLVQQLKEERAMPILGVIDVTGVTSALTDAGTAVGTVGVAVLVVIVGVAAYKFIRRAL